MTIPSGHIAFMKECSQTLEIIFFHLALFTACLSPVSGAMLRLPFLLPLGT